MKSRYWFCWLVGAALLIQASALAGMSTKLRVTHIPGAPLYKTPALGQPIMILPLNTPLDAEVKQSEFWKVTIDKNGVKTTGYIHEFLVEEVGESELQEDTAPIGSIKTQAQLAAEIELKIEENKSLILQQSDLPQAIDSLRSLIPKIFSLEDPQKQKQIACDIYLWTGHAFSKLDDDSQAIKEFSSMFEVDFLSAKRATKYIADSNVSQLIGTAEKQYNGTFVGYTFQVDTEPKEAVLKIDGQVVGRSPDVFTTNKPKVTLEIEKEGYKSEKFVVFLKDAKNLKSYVLQSLGKTIRIGSEPPGAAVFLDGRDTGKVTECELVHVLYGSHRLTIKKDGYAEWEEEVTISDGSGAYSKTAMLTAKAYSPTSAWGTPESKTFILPRALVLDKAGNFYVADESPFKVRKYDPDRRTQISWGGGGKSPKSLKLASGIAIDGDGACYVTDARSSSVSKFDKNGQLVRKWGDLGPKERLLSRPLGVAVDGNNDIYVVDSGNSRVVKYSSVGVLKKTWGKPGSEPGQFYLPTGVAVNSRNEVIVVEAGRIQKFTSEGVFIEAFGKLGSADGELNRCLGVSCDKDNNIYVADGGNHRVKKFSPDGRFIGSFGGRGTGIGQMTGPIAMAINGKGSVFVLERDNGRIQEFRPPGK
jgi:DNA-binding beta-propeller fold protein YncE